MKHASLLIALCVLFGFAATAQSTSTKEKSKRITITTSKTDESGKVITETWIAEGEEPQAILQEMAVHPDVIRKVEIENASEGDGERLFLIRHAGEDVVIEGTINDNSEQEVIREIIIKTEDGEQGNHVFWMEGPCHGKQEHVRVFSCEKVEERKSNCAALGVYVYSDSEAMGTRITELIEKGGAGEAGLKAGDLITKIDEFDVEDYSTLHLALSHFKPGETVKVTYDRDDRINTTKVLLKDWAELPGFEHKSRPDCKEEEVLPREPYLDQPGDDPSSIPNTTLDLVDVSIFPNPTADVVSVSFTAEPKPLTVSVMDVNGKMVFQEESENASGYFNRDISLKNFPNGHYVLYVRQENKVFAQQLSKQ